MHLQIIIGSSKLARIPPLASRINKLTGSRHFSSTPPVRSLAGTVAPHHSYFLLHTHRPPREYPARSKSPLLHALTRHALSWGGLVNFSWSEQQAVHPGYVGLGEAEGEQEVYRATAFSHAGGCIDIPEVSLANVGSVVKTLYSHALGDLPATTPDKSIDKLHLYVCTHGERDCRCGDTGSEVAGALRKEISRRGLTQDISLGEVAHVGGHKYAANLLVFPFGDWLGMLQGIDAPAVLDEILERRSQRAVESLQSAPLCPPFWRGRMGLNKHDQIALHSRS